MKAIYYKKENGVYPFKNWLNSLDEALKVKVQAKIYKLQNNNYSDRSILKGTEGIKEARIRRIPNRKIQGSYDFFIHNFKRLCCYSTYRSTRSKSSIGFS